VSSQVQKAVESLCDEGTRQAETNADPADSRV